MKTVNWKKDHRVTLSSIIGNDPEAQYTINDVRAGLKIMGKLDGESEIIELEDAEYDFIKRRVSRVGWRVINHDVAAFLDAIMPPA